MKNFSEYADNAKGFAQPYVKKTSDFFTSKADDAQNWYIVNRKKYEKRRRKAKIKRFFEESRNIILIIGGIICGIAAVIAAVRIMSGKVGHTLACCDDTPCDCAQATDENVDKNEKDTKTNGYITL